MLLRNKLRRQQDKRRSKRVLPRWKLFVSRWRLKKRPKTPKEKLKNSKCVKRWKS